ncbi:MAG TPA: flagellar export chaperone FlgN [Anaerolineales bacterium]|nr:flagellar export chaperone FlgN [Anaerolineales bacterium]
MTQQQAAAILEQIERILAREFRLYQGLLALTKQERQALIAGALEDLSEIVRQKELSLEQLNQLEVDRVSALGAWSRAHGGDATLVALMADVDEEIAARFGRLRDRMEERGYGPPRRAARHLVVEGILAIASQLRDFGLANRALAQVALERLEATRSYLLTLATPAPAYGPQPTAAPRLTLAVEVSA